jgi:pilus assembly protein CpaE
LNNGTISLKKAQETIGREIFWQLPNDYRTMMEVRNNGVPLIEQAPKAGITLSITDLAKALCGPPKSEEVAEEASDKPAAKPGRSLFGFMRGK